MKILGRSNSDQWFVALIGVGLLAIAVLGLVHGTRAALAQIWYRQAKYGAASGEAEQILGLCRRAFVWYRWNYYFSIEAAERAYAAAEAGTATNREALLCQSQFWCERGLIQNRWKSQLRRLKVRFLWETSPSEAIRFWEAHTQWQFWDPYNHAVLAELHARAGDFEDAERSLKWTEGTLEYEPTRKALQAEKTAWNEAVNGDRGRWGE
jgi:hypothetical protein